MTVHERTAGTVEVTNDRSFGEEVDLRLPTGHSPRTAPFLVAEVEPRGAVEGIPEHRRRPGERVASPHFGATDHFQRPAALDHGDSHSAEVAAGLLALSKDEQRLAKFDPIAVAENVGVVDYCSIDACPPARRVVAEQIALRRRLDLRVTSSHPAVTE